MRMLVSRGYVEAVGRDDGPGQAVLFGTTATFLERLGLDSSTTSHRSRPSCRRRRRVELLEKVLRAEPGE